MAHQKGHINHPEDEDDDAEELIETEETAPTLMQIVAKGVVLDTVMQNGAKPGRVAQLQEEIDADVVKYSQAKFRDRHEEQIAQLRSNVFLLSENQKRLEQKNARLTEILVELSKRIETLEQAAATAAAAATKQRSPRSDVEPPKRPVAESLSRPVAVAPPQRPFTVFDGTKSVRVG